MKGHKLHYIIILILVLTLYCFKPSDLSLISNKDNNITNNFGIIHTKYDFINIFVTNSVVGLVLSIAGFFTGGILTLLIIVWNILLVWILYWIALSNNNNISTILYLLKHAPLEIYALAMFSIIGFRGFKFYRKLVKLQLFDIELLPNIKELILPIILLLLASLIEVS